MKKITDPRLLLDGDTFTVNGKKFVIHRPKGWSVNEVWYRRMNSEAVWSMSAKTWERLELVAIQPEPEQLVDTEVQVGSAEQIIVTVPGYDGRQVRVRVDAL